MLFTHLYLLKETHSICLHRWSLSSGCTVWFSRCDRHSCTRKMAALRWRNKLSRFPKHLYLKHTHVLWGVFLFQNSLLFKLEDKAFWLAFKCKGGGSFKKASPAYPLYCQWGIMPSWDHSKLLTVNRTPVYFSYCYLIVQKCVSVLERCRRRCYEKRDTLMTPATTEKNFPWLKLIKQTKGLV